MFGSAAQRFEQNMELARALGPVVSRGVLQHFFVSPVLPRTRLDSIQITDAWRRLVTEIRAGRSPELLTLYVHIPFCSHRCRYCIYHSVGDFDPVDLSDYLDRVHQEIDHYAPVFEGVRFATCYLGGGTPTVLSEEQLERLLSMIDANFGRLAGGEWAFECNPLTITEGKARLFEKHGFNRVSFGVQTLNADVLESVNRGYQSMDRLVETFRVLHAGRFWINVDLIHGLPGDTVESTELSLEELLEFEPTQVTIYALSPYTPMKVGRAGTLPLDELATRLEPLAQRAGYQLGYHHTCLDVSRVHNDDNRLREAHRSAGRLYPYDDTTVEPFSLLGIGPTSRCYIYGQLAYLFDAFDPSAPFDPEAKIARGRNITLLEERRRYVVHQLGLPSGLSLRAFRDRFGEELGTTFGDEVDALLHLDQLERLGDVLRSTARDPVARFATELFFVGDEMLEAARRGAAKEWDPATGNQETDAPNEPVPLWGLQLEARGAAVQVVLTEYWPGRPCFHHRGEFAFFIPSELPEGRCCHTQLEERLLAAFRRLFDRIIDDDAPDSVQALHRALFTRGSRLHLTTQTESGTEQLPVVLTSLP